MPPPAHLRDQYVVGACGTYLVPTVVAVDGQLDKLRAALHTTRAARRADVLADIDLLLERRTNLQATSPEET